MEAPALFTPAKRLPTEKYDILPLLLLFFSASLVPLVKVELVQVCLEAFASAAAGFADAVLVPQVLSPL
jgi:hypothetical protein